MPLLNMEMAAVLVAGKYAGKPLWVHLNYQQCISPIPLHLVGLAQTPTQRRMSRTCTTRCYNVWTKALAT